MKVFDVVVNGIQYISEGVARIFSPRDDEYPETGVQPFDGEPLSKCIDANITTTHQKKA